MFTLRKSPRMPSVDEALPGRNAPLPTAESHFVNGNPLKGPYPPGFEKALFGLGCFWGAERKFWQVPGVYVTAAGYTAGLIPNPTYEETCTGLTGHNEAVLVVYNPVEINYNQLLALFWESHDPTQGVLEAIKLSRNDQVFLLSTNYAVDQSFSEEARDIFANNYRQQAFILRSAPNTLITRLLPRSAAPAGIVAPKEILRSTHYVMDIAHLSRKLSSSDFLTRARRLN